MAQQSTEESLAMNRTRFRVIGRWIVSKGSSQRAIAKTLVRSMLIVESNVLTQDMIEVSSTEAGKVVQALALERTNPRFGKCVRIRRLYRRFHDTDTCIIEQCVERWHELRVAVTEKEPCLDIFVLHPHLHVPRLLHHPLSVRVVGGRTYEDSAALQVNEKQDVCSSGSEGRPNAFREEVARNERVHV
jgi:hypothetical protein